MAVHNNRRTPAGRKREGYTDAQQGSESPRWAQGCHGGLGERVGTVSSERLGEVSDGVLAIIITVMLLALPVPKGTGFTELWNAVGTALLTYALSFTYVGIYWNNHHHVFQLTNRVTGGVLWANLHLLFWLSLLPLATAWMDYTGFARAPVMSYGAVLLFAALAFVPLQRTIARSEGPDSRMQCALGRDKKGKASLVLYLAGIASAAFIKPEAPVFIYLALACFVAVAVVWVIPDRRIESSLEQHGGDE